MATSPSEPSSSEPSGVRFQVLAGGTPTAEEVAAIAAALEVVLAQEVTPPLRPNRWRWSGRRWQDEGTDWRRRPAPAHPSRR